MCFFLSVHLHCPDYSRPKVQYHTTQYNTIKYIQYIHICTPNINCVPESISPVSRLARGYMVDI